MARGHTVVVQARLQRAEVLVARQVDVDPAQAQGGGAGASALAVPCVERDVVVVAAGGDEQGGADLALDLEAEGGDVELPRGVDVADLQVDMP